ncbi:unnamed protein product [Dimorphilus gyrociliatus]|uniref:Uncharacterized protein n=1 Tax=Dimorphilus gyrociliatus TaxID=2664684 RepID=A0A7I8WA49_9ANNE|nr:unnamed protein product [Dimorphilus gyrociliatus]
MLKLLLIINLFLFDIVNSAPVYTPIENRAQAVKYLVKYGYLSSVEAGNNMNDLQRAVESFQIEFGLNITKMLDSPTITAMAKPRCKMSNINMTMSMGKPDMMYKLHDPAANMKIFTWTIVTFLDKLPRDLQYEAVEKGLQKWADKCDLVFHRVDVENAHIRIHFEYIDSPGSTLAFAFYPGYTNSGKQIYDSSESWTMDNAGHSLQYVVTHETGHTLGIMHSSDPLAIMYPSYNYLGGDYSITPDDESACKILFGEKKDNGCFGPNGKVLLRDGGTVLMKDLRIGDVVQTSANAFSRVVTLLDRNEKSFETFIRLRTQSGNFIELTKKHLIPIKSSENEEKRYVFAQNVLLGSKVYSVVDGKEIEDEVIEISSKTYQGYYSPLTFHGTIVINGIQASCYAEVESQSISHWSMFPLRSLSYIKNMLSVSKVEDFEGIHWYGRLSKQYALPIAKNLGIL